jgi:hypothetical protein
MVQFFRKKREKDTVKKKLDSQKADLEEFLRETSLKCT